jgi:glutaredoxin 3
MGIITNTNHNDNSTTTTNHHHDNNNDIRQFIENENSKYQVVVWSKSYCPYCANTKQLFNETTGIQPKSIKIYDLDQMGTKGIKIQKELYNITNQTTVPNIFINNRPIGGNDNVQQLYKTGQLQQFLK